MDDIVGLLIIDTQAPSSRDNENVRLLWSAALFVSCCSISSFPTSVAMMYLVFDTLSEHQKFDLYLKKLKQSADADQEQVSELEKGYQFILKMKKTKGKSKQQIVLQMQMENIFKQINNDYKAWIAEIIEKLSLIELLPHATDSELENEKPISLWRLPQNSGLDEAKKIIDLFTLSIPNCGTMPFFYENIKNFIAPVELNKYDGSTKKIMLTDFLFEFSEPLSLTTMQVHIVRDAMSKNIHRFFNELEPIANEFLEIPFTPDTIPTIVSLYKERTQELKPTLQKAIDENEIMQQLAVTNPKTVTYKIWLAISSFENVLSLYKNNEIIEANTEQYIKEEIEKKHGLNKTKIFLFLEPIINTPKTDDSV